jgi:hypothetical protein
MEYIDRFDLFPTPVLRYGFKDIELHHENLVKYLARDDLYFKDKERNGVQTTDGDLFNHKEMEPVYNLFTECFNDAMDKLGYEKDHGIISMWATRQRDGGFHHQHIHKNTFLAAVLYLFDIDGTASGTTFHNLNRNLHQIDPRHKKDADRFFKDSENVPFINGTVLVFPGWASHSTIPSPSRYRIMVAANMMPIGRTTSDHYDQYYYHDPKEKGYLNLVDHIKEGYSK